MEEFLQMLAPGFIALCVLDQMPLAPHFTQRWRLLRTSNVHSQSTAAFDAPQGPGCGTMSLRRPQLG
jgi:hypothetical protein